MASRTYHSPLLGSSPSISHAARLITSAPYRDTIPHTESSADSHDPSTWTFTHFSDLPTELRLKIWELAIQDHRIVKVKAETRSDGVVLLKVSNPTPPLVRVNRESREVALKIYTMSFSRQFYGKPVYFAHQRDVIQFEESVALRAFTDYGRRPLSKEIDERLTILAIGLNASLPW